MNLDGFRPRCACDRIGEEDLAALLSSGHVDAWLPRIAEQGGRPGNAVLVLTDRQNVAWFYDEAHAPAVPAEFEQAVLGRRIDEVLPRLFAVCRRCAERLVAVPLTHLPVLVRIGETGEMVLGAVRFPEALRAQASAVAPTPSAGVRSTSVRRLTDGELPDMRPRTFPLVRASGSATAMVLRPEDLADAHGMIARAILGYAHAEAYCLLRYRDEHGGEETVWNSRDASAPPAFEHPLTGGLFALVETAALERAPHHRPAEGDLVWVELTEARALAERRAYVCARWDVDTPFVGPLRLDPRFAGMDADQAARQLAAQDLAGPGRAVLVRWGMELAS